MEQCDEEILELVGKSKTFYRASIFMDEFKMAAGINMLNHYKSIITFFRKILSNKLEPTGSPPFEVIKSKSKNVDEQALASRTQKIKGQKTSSSINSWDKNRMNFHGQINIKLKKINLDILTHTSPFSEDCLRLSMGLAYFKHETEKVTFLIENIALIRLEERINQKNADALGLRDDQTAILQVPLVELVVKLKWHSATNDHYVILKYLQQQQVKTPHAKPDDLDPLKGFKSRDLAVEIKVNIPHKEDADKTSIYPLVFEEGDLGKLVQNSPVPIFHYQTTVFADLLSLPQLRHEYLMLNGIRLVSYKAIDQGASVATSTLHTNKNQKSKSKMQKTEENDNLDEATTPVAEKDGSKTNKKVMETITKLFTHGEHAEEFTSYLDIIAFALDQQLNVKGKKNIFSWVSEVDFRLNTSIVRILMTNTNPDQVKSVPANLKKDKLNKTQSSAKKDKSKFNIFHKTEKKTSKIDKEPLNDDDCYKVCGVQAVINSVKFQTTFYKKEVVK